MNRTLRTTLALSALAAVAMSAVGCAAGGPGGAAAADSGETGAQQILVATGASPKPYTFLDESDELTGYDIEILKRIDDKLEGLEFEFQVADFPALFAGLDSGRFNLVANNLSATDERREKYDFSDPYIEAQFGIIQQAGAAKVTALDDLAGKKTYGEPGLNFTRVLESYNEQHPGKEILIEYTELDLQSQYNNLATGSVDFLFNERVVFQGYGGSSGLELEFTQLDGDYLTENFGTNLLSAYALSKQTPNVADVIEQINGALAELAADGTLTELSEQFFDGLDVTPSRTAAAG
ncbi:ABC transporter substrate-binding protein [Leucobacter sp. BZR 635]